MKVTNGKQLEDEAKKIIEKVIAGRLGVKVFQNLQLQGCSGNWHRPDIVLAAELLLYPGQYSFYLATIECKNTGEGVKPRTYWSNMSRAYMELNDLRFNFSTSEFFLVVNRYPTEHESPKFDYPSLFEKIGVKMININDPKERAYFEEQIQTLLKKGSRQEQTRLLEELFRKSKKHSGR